MTPARRQIAWTLAWTAVATALAARYAPPPQVASFAFAILLAASLRWVLRGRSHYLELAAAVTMLGLAASRVAGIETSAVGGVPEPPLARLLAAVTQVFLSAFLADRLAGRRTLPARTLVAGAVAPPVAFAIAYLLAYTALSTVRLKLLGFPLPGRLEASSRAFGFARSVLSWKVCSPLIAGSIAALRTGR